MKQRQIARILRGGLSALRVTIGALANTDITQNRGSWGGRHRLPSNTLFDLFNYHGAPHQCVGGMVSKILLIAPLQS